MANEISNRDFIIECKDPEMILAQEYYNWQRLDKADEYYYADLIVSLYNFLVKNKHRLQGDI